jgi:hypothetical protein
LVAHVYALESYSRDYNDTEFLQSLYKAATNYSLEQYVDAKDGLAHGTVLFPLYQPTSPP